MALIFFYVFAETQKRILNTFVRQGPIFLDELSGVDYISVEYYCELA